MLFPVRISDRLPSIRLSPVAIGRKPRSAACFRKRVSVLLPCNHPNGLNGWSLWSRPHASSILRVSALRRTTDWSPKVSHLGSPHENLMRNLSGRREFARGRWWSGPKGLRLLRKSQTASLSGEKTTATAAGSPPPRVIARLKGAFEKCSFWFYGRAS